MSLSIIDTHAHIYLPDFETDSASIIERATQAGIRSIVLPNIDHSTVEKVFSLGTKYPQYCLVAMGLHPCSVTADYKNQLLPMEDYIKLKHVVAIGETGIDLYWDKTFIAEQIESFTIQLQWGLRYKKPVIIHVRESFDETFDTLDNTYQPGLTGVFHCFTGNEEQAKKALSFEGFYLGIGGVLTYKNSALREVLKTIPTNRIVLETDSPYLPPVPHRGKRNEPAYIIHVLETAAETLGISTQELADITTANAKKLFAI